MDATLGAIEKLVETFVKRDGPLELEMRLGVFSGDDGRFSAGVPRETFDALLEDLRCVEGFQSDGKFSEIVDYHYILDDGTDVRTRVSYDVDRMTIVPVHITKKSVGSCIVASEDSLGQCSCRVALSSEATLSDVPPICFPTHVRIKQRIVFEDVRGGSVVWSYELSKTWSGPNRTAVESKQHISEPTYEVECELVDANGAYAGEKTADYVAESIVMKTNMLLGKNPKEALSLMQSECNSHRKRRRRC